MSSYCDSTVESRDRELTAEGLRNDTYAGKSVLHLVIGVIHRPNVFQPINTFHLFVVFIVVPA